jgi:Ribbon-helix-helix protein, copG family.
MTNNKTTRLYTRVSPEEMKRIRSLAKKCGLSVSEYVRQRALGFTPRTAMSESLFDTIRQFENACQEMEGEEEQKLLRKLISSIRQELVKQENDREVK